MMDAMSVTSNICTILLSSNDQITPCKIPHKKTDYLSTVIE
jgi:hypothetical protein